MTDQSNPEPSPARRRRVRADPAEPTRIRRRDAIAREPGEPAGPARSRGRRSAAEAVVRAQVQELAEEATPAVATPAVAPPRAATEPPVAVVERLDLERGAVGGIRGGDVSARLAAVGGIAAKRASLEMGVASGIAALEATADRSLVRGVVAGHVRVERALIRTVLANRVEAGPGATILVAIARRIDGEARILVDWRGALAFGAALGAFLALARLRRR